MHLQCYFISPLQRKRSCTTSLQMNILLEWKCQYVCVFDCSVQLLDVKWNAPKWLSCVYVCCYVWRGTLSSVQTGVKIFWWVAPKNKEWWQMLCRTCSCSYLLYTAAYWCDINHNEAKLHVLRRCLSILHIVHQMTEHRLNIVGVNWTQCTLYGMFHYSINISVLYFSCYQKPSGLRFIQVTSGVYLALAGVSELLSNLAIMMFISCLFLGKDMNAASGGVMSLRKWEVCVRKGILCKICAKSSVDSFCPPSRQGSSSNYVSVSPVFSMKAEVIEAFWTIPPWAVSHLMIQPLRYNCWKWCLLLAKAML